MDLEQLEAFYRRYDFFQKPASEPDAEYDPEEEQALLDEWNADWYASRGV